MKQRILMLALLGFSFLSVSVQAARGGVSETTGGPDTSGRTVTVDAALLSSSGVTSPGVTAGMSWRHNADTPLYYGGEVGVYFNSTPSSVTIPLLAQAYYLFEIDSAVHPLIGAMIGPVFSTGPGSSAEFGLLFRPGVNVELGKSVALNAEARFGVIGGTGVFQPQLGVIFAM